MSSKPNTDRDAQRKHGHDGHGPRDGEREEATCGHELAADAEVPDLLARLIAHVAENMVSHAKWVGESSPGGELEAQGLQRVADHYRAVAAAAGQAAAAMRAMQDTPAAPHDLARLDRAALAKWMRAKVVLQRKLAHVLLNHAERSEAVLRKMDASAPELPATSSSPPPSDK
ncbi:MAG TPA: hypothetical protein VHV30_01250 [Polyangiaceae bacterium]|jgi:hypothetical protein|nr:hypothetical protein [Polyangiaceae bacterium]